VVMDVHIRPFRPLRYARFVPDDALWSRAQTRQIGQATIQLPSREDMLLHLAVHGAIHGNLGGKWGGDIRRWLQQYGHEMDWTLLIQTSRRWRLNLPLLQGLTLALGLKHRGLLPGHVEYQLATIPSNWRDRLALRHAPCDNDHPVAHVLVNALTTPGLGFIVGYLLAAFFPDRRHMLEWYGREHIGWLALAHLLRWLRPVTRIVGALWPWKSPYEVVQNDVNGPYVVARRAIQVGQRIGCYRVKACSGQSRFTVFLQNQQGKLFGYNMIGSLRYVTVDSQPNAQLDGYTLIARRRILPQEPITISPDRIVTAAAIVAEQLEQSDKAVRKVNSGRNMVNHRRAA